MKEAFFTVILLLNLLLLACSDTGTANKASNTPEESPQATNAEPETDPSPSARSAPADERTVETRDFEGTVKRTEKKYSPREAVILTEVRAGRHDRFDRVVFEFLGDELPAYRIEYIDKPVRACGSGDVVPIKGDGWLQIRFEPARAHTDQGKATIAFRALEPKLQNLLEIRSICDFEAQVEWVAGVASPNSYRVIELKAPTRLAVDIKHK